MRERVSLTVSSQRTSGSPINVSCRWCVWLLAICATGLSIARIATLESPDPHREGPFLSANDRSRWCTVRSLVEHHTFAIDAVIAGDEGAAWDTIDKVYHAGPDGRMHFYSSKPPLWPAFLAGQYWIVHQVWGLDLESYGFLIPRVILIVNIAVALGLLVWLMGRIAEELGASSLTQMFVAAVTAFGTSLTTFSVTLNNHLPAAVLCAGSFWCLLRLWTAGGGLGLYGLLGLTAGLTAALELPATGWLALCAAVAFVRSPVRCLVAMAPAVGLVAAAFFAVNYWAHGTWKPAYDYREDGSVVAEASGDFGQTLDRGLLPSELFAAIDASGDELGFRIAESSPVVAGEGIGSQSAGERRWIVNRDRPDQLVITRDAGSNRYLVRSWRNWYDFEGSYWLAGNDRKSEVDRGERDPVRYLVHMTVGHHGVLSLSPVFLLSLLGLPLLLFQPRYGVRLPAAGMLALTLVVFVFYVTRPPIDRNYGGVCSGLRWVFWLYPIWIVWMAPILDGMLSHRWMRALAGMLLGASVVSASIAWANPWSHPWLSGVLAAWGLD